MVRLPLSDLDPRYLMLLELHLGHMASPDLYVPVAVAVTARAPHDFHEPGSAILFLLPDFAFLT
jgi:hypothetical protein